VKPTPPARSVDPQKDLGQIIRLESTAVKLADYQARAWFEFTPDQDHLSAVSVSVTQDTTRSGVFDVLKDGLVEKYGRATSSDSVTDHNSYGSAIVTRTITWRVKSSMITLEWIESRSVGMVTVRYAERKPDPTL
jgi:hypothetical protein